MLSLSLWHFIKYHSAFNCRCVVMYMDELVYLSEPERVIMQAITDNVQFDICEFERRSNISRFIMRCLMHDSLVTPFER